MSRLTFFILLILAMQVNAANLNSIPRDTVPADFTISDYEIKSRNQLTGAIVLVGMGAVSMTVGIVGYSAIVYDSWQSVLNAKHPYKYRSGDGYGVAIITGAVLALASIPLFIASSKNKKLVRSASLIAFNMEAANTLQTGGFSKTYFPAIKLTLRF